MLLIFDRKHSLLSIVGQYPEGRLFVFDEFSAANNTASDSRGPWPAGVYKAEKIVHLEGDQADPNGPYGEWFLRFIVPDRDGIDDRTDLDKDGNPTDANDGPGIGMGIHAGRRDGKDLKGRSGYQRATMGCIRTTDDAMKTIAGVFQKDREALLVVLP